MVKVSISKLWVSAVFLASAFCANASVVDIQEVSSKGSGYLNEYVVSNNSGYNIVLFGVTNSVKHDVYTSRPGWASMSASKDQWNAGLSLFGGRFDTGVSESGTSLGSFESIFGSLENYVNLYFVDDFTNFHLQYIWSGNQNVTGFYFNAPAASEYAAFNTMGNVIYKSHVDSVSVPEPTSLILLCLGLAGIVMTRRRKI